MARPEKCKRICSLPKNNYFYAKNADNQDDMQVMTLTLEEYETIRLIDYIGLTQEQCAEQMHVARTTVPTPAKNWPFISSKGLRLKSAEEITWSAKTTTPAARNSAANTESAAVPATFEPMDVTERKSIVCKIFSHKLFAQTYRFIIDICLK